MSSIRKQLTETEWEAICIPRFKLETTFNLNDVRDSRILLLFSAILLTLNANAQVSCVSALSALSGVVLRSRLAILAFLQLSADSLPLLMLILLIAALARHFPSSE